MRSKGNGLFECPPEEAEYVWLNIPGLVGNCILPVIQSGPRKDKNCWTWNGSTDKPTLKPSVLTNISPLVCHSYITDGKIKFLEDSTHEFKGQTLDLLEVE